MARTGAYGIEVRRRVKEQLKKIGGMEFYDVQFSYVRLANMEEVFVPVLEQGGGKLIPEGNGKPGHVYTVADGTNGMKGLFKLEAAMTEGSGRFDVTGMQSATLLIGIRILFAPASKATCRVDASSSTLLIVPPMDIDPSTHICACTGRSRAQLQ